MKRMREPSEKLHNALYFLSGMMAVLLVLVIVIGVRTKAENAKGRSVENAQEPATVAQIQQQTSQTQTQSEKWQEGVISYKGQEYLYNSDIKTYLMMGVDVDDPVKKTEDYTQGGQADALFLLVVNNKTQELKVVSINRNTITEIELCDKSGYDMGPLDAQICLQHAFGDGMRLSCTRTVDVVAKLFGNIPISGYFAMNMGAIPQMNDAIGGVTVKALQSVSFPDAGVDIKKGETRTLNGTEAYYYLHGRDTKKYDSATDRLHREEQYIVAYMDQLKKISAGDTTKVTVVYDSIADYMVSSVDFASLIEELMNYEFQEDQMYTVPGTTTEGMPIDGKRYEEYHVDEDALQDLIMQIFYKPVQ